MFAVIAAGLVFVCVPTVPDLAQTYQGDVVMVGPRDLCWREAGWLNEQVARGGEFEAVSPVTGARHTFWLSMDE